ncbi:hypothetical protein GCM10022384_66840 [Streptomyces marokkonensis]|uniref:Uncharacterized protein n=1 Tax=Streptomyces marokkonensis TaxID=324855 RepID=A0ABP7SKF1_9ACTN
MRRPGRLSGRPGPSRAFRTGARAITGESAAVNTAQPGNDGSAAGHHGGPETPRDPIHALAETPHTLVVPELLGLLERTGWSPAVTRRISRAGSVPLHGTGPEPAADVVPILSFQELLMAVMVPFSTPSASPPQASTAPDGRQDR